MKLRGFTMVELLVVIVIIGLLAALAVPGIGKALNQARIAESQSNLRQIGLALQMHAQENNGLLPVARGTLEYKSDWESVPEVERSWQMQIIPYTGGNEKIFHSSRVASLHSASKKWSYFLGSHAAGVEASTEGASDLFRPLNLQKIKFPSQHIMAGECLAGMSLDDSDKDDYNSNNPAFRGKDTDIKVNILFADGHIESLTRADPARLAVLYSGPDPADPTKYFEGSN